MDGLAQKLSRVHTAAVSVATSTSRHDDERNRDVTTTINHPSGVKSSGMVDSVVAMTVLAIIGGLSLMFRLESGRVGRAGHWADVVAKYVIATFLGTYASVGTAGLLVLPMLLFGRLAHSQTAEQIFSAAVDRPYFPLQSVVAFVVGFAVAVRLRQGGPLWVWVWPVTQVAISVALHRPGSVMQSVTTGVWRTYFNWDCRCSATLLQWTVMSALYTSIAFALGVLARYAVSGRSKDSCSRQIVDTPPLNKA